MTSPNANAAQGLPTPAAQIQNDSTAILNDYSDVVNYLDFPDPETVKGRTLGALLRGDRLTSNDCLFRFGSARLSHHVYVLRGGKSGCGWPIEIDEEVVETSDAHRKATIGVYYLSEQAIRAAGERGQNYAKECARIESERRAS